MSQAEERHNNTNTTSTVNNSNNTNFDNNNNDVVASPRHLLFIDFDGKFKARLGAVIPTHVSSVSENAPISAKYDRRIKAEYHKDIMGLVDSVGIIG